MDHQADIDWIKDELDRLNDPQLVGLFKRLLQLKNRNQQLEMDRMILEAEEEIENGRVFTAAEMESRMLSWRK